MKSTAIVFLTLLAACGSSHAGQLVYRYGIAAEIDPSGRVIGAELNDEDVPPVFADAVETLVKQWRFNPARVNGLPVTVTTMLQAQVLVNDDRRRPTMTARYLSHGAEVLTHRALPPSYPEDAIGARASAEVALMVTVSAGGEPAQIALHSLKMDVDNKGLARQFEKAAIKTVQRWEFRPETLAGQPVASRLMVPIRFTGNHPDPDSRRWKWMTSPEVDPHMTLDFETQQPVAMDNATGLTLLSDGSKT
jgi:TonB family protein